VPYAALARRRASCCYCKVQEPVLLLMVMSSQSATSIISGLPQAVQALPQALQALSQAFPVASGSPCFPQRTAQEESTIHLVYCWTNPAMAAISTYHVVVHHRGLVSGDNVERWSRHLLSGAKRTCGELRGSKGKRGRQRQRPMIRTHPRLPEVFAAAGSCCGCSNDTARLDRLDPDPGTSGFTCRVSMTKQVNAFSGTM
jgi:hypothetical protein